MRVTSIRLKQIKNLIGSIILLINVPHIEVNLFVFFDNTKKKEDQPILKKVQEEIKFMEIRPNTYKIEDIDPMTSIRELGHLQIT